MQPVVDPARALRRRDDEGVADFIASAHLVVRLSQNIPMLDSTEAGTCRSRDGINCSSKDATVSIVASGVCLGSFFGCESSTF